MLQFDQIEKKIGSLIRFCKSLEAAKSELESKVQSLEAELQQKDETESKYSEQKAMIRNKIDGLLSKLDNLSELENE